MNDIEELLKKECTYDELNLIHALIKITENTSENKLKEALRNAIDEAVL